MIFSITLTCVAKEGLRNWDTKIRAQELKLNSERSVYWLWGWFWDICGWIASWLCWGREVLGPWIFWIVMVLSIFRLLFAIQIPILPFIEDYTLGLSSQSYINGLRNILNGQLGYSLTSPRLSDSPTHQVSVFIPAPLWKI